MRPPVLLLGLAGVWTSVFWIFCVALPVGALFRLVQTPSGISALWDPDILSVVSVTFRQALLSTAISGILGLALGLWVGRVVQKNPSSRLMSVLAIPNGIPSVVAGAAWIALLGHAGFLSRQGLELDWIYSLKSVVLAHVFLNTPLVAWAVAQSRMFVDPRLLEAAATLGSGPIGRVRNVIWPQVKWAWASVLAQVMSLCVMTFGLVLILGGGPPVLTLEVELYQRLRYGGVDVAGAAACGCWELLLTSLPWALALFFRRGFSFEMPSVFRSTRLPTSFSKRQRGELVLLFGMSFLGVLPYLFAVNRYTLLLFNPLDPRWASFWREILPALQVSLSLVFWTSSLTLLTGLMSVFWIESVSRSSLVGSRISRVLSGLLMLPSGISVLVLSLGAWLAFQNFFDPFAGSLKAIIALQVTIFFPFAFRVLWPIAQGTQLRALEAAFSLGASPIKAFRWIEWPRWKAPILSVLAAVGGGTLGELGAVSMFYNEKLVPLPLLVSRWMSHYRFEEAEGIAGLLLVLSAAFVVGSIEIGNRSNYESATR